MNYRQGIRASAATLLVAALVGGAQPAVAGTATANLDVLATVDPACHVTTTAVDFGIIDPTLNTTPTATGSVNVTCTAGTAWTASAGQGQNVVFRDATNWVRQMKSQTLATPSYLVYLLYTDSARTQLWSSAPGPVYSGVGTGSAQTNTVYGAVPPGQMTTPVDSYKDTVLVTVTY